MLIWIDESQSFCGEIERRAAKIDVPGILIDGTTCYSVPKMLHMGSEARESAIEMADVAAALAINSQIAPHDFDGQLEREYRYPLEYLGEVALMQ